MQPLKPVRVLWRYDGTTAYPTVEPAAAASQALLAGLAGPAWPHPVAAYDHALPLGELPAEQLLSLLVHPPARPDRYADLPDGWWERSAQVFACLGLLHCAELRNPADPGDTTAQRRLLTDVAWGVEDWTTEAALFALTVAAWLDPACRVEVCDTVGRRFLAAVQASRTRAVTIRDSLAGAGAHRARDGRRHARPCRRGLRYVGAGPSRGETGRPVTVRPAVPAASAVARTASATPTPALVSGETALETPLAGGEPPASARSTGGLPVVASPGERAADRTEDPQHRAHDQQHDADRLQDADVQEEPEQEQDQAKDDHFQLPGRRGVHGHSSDTPPPPSLKHGSPAAAPAGAEVVGDHVPAQVTGLRGEHPAAAAPGHRVDEPAQAGVLAEHEHVERGAVAGQLVHLDARWRWTVSGQRRPVEDASPSSGPGARSARRRSPPAPPARRPGAGAGAGRPAAARAAGWCPARSPARPRPARPADSGIAYRPKPMICSASCGNRVATRCDSASAVCFIGPQRPSAIIENDRSTQSATAADGPPLGLGDLEVLDVQRAPARCRRPAARRRRRTALPTVRTTSSGCSSPNSQRRDAPVSSPAAPGVAQVVLPAPAAGEVGEDLAQRGAARAGAAPSGDSVRPVAAAGHPALPAQLALQLAAAARTSSAARPAELAFDRLDVDVVQGRARVLLAELVEQVVELGRSPPARRSPRRSRAAARRGSARRRPQFRSGPQRPQVVAQRGHLRRPARPSPSAWAISPASSSRCCGLSERISRSPAAARRASKSTSSSTFCRVLREELAVLGHELGERVGRCPRRGRAGRAGR